MAAISLKDVVKRYGSGPKANQVIHGVNAEVADGEFIVIVGPSGCGKSTLLRMVAGLEEISGGTISIGGRVVNDLEPAHARGFSTALVGPGASADDRPSFRAATVAGLYPDIRAWLDLDPSTPTSLDAPHGKQMHA